MSRLLPLAVLSALICSVLPASATTRYVNNTDSTCGGHSPCHTSIAAALSAMAGGDDVRIQKANPYNECGNIVTKGGPSTSAPTIIESDNPAGSSQAVLQCNSLNAGSALFIGSRSVLANNVTVQNLTFAGGSGNDSQAAIEVDEPGISNEANAATGIQILNNTFTNWGANNVTGYSDGCGISQGCFDTFVVYLNGGYIGSSPGCCQTQSGTIVGGNTFTGVRNGAIVDSNGTLTQIINNTIIGMSCGTWTGYTNMTGTIPTINSIWTGGLGGFGTTNASANWGGLIKGNTISNPASTCNIAGVSASNGNYDAIHCDGGNNSTAENGIVDSNFIYGNTLGGASGSSGIHVEEHCSGWILKNNIIDNWADGPNVFGQIYINPNDSVAGPTDVYNNTIANGPGAGLRADSGTSNIINNIFYNNGIQVMLDGFSGTTAAITGWNFNDYWDLSGGGHVGGVGFTGPSSAQPFASWKSACSSKTGITCDANSINVNPLLVTGTGTVSNNYNLQSTSPCINAGTTLTTVPTDFAGTARPQGPAYDLGAFEFTSGQLTTPPALGTCGSAVGTAALTIGLTNISSGQALVVFHKGITTDPTISDTLGDTFTTATVGSSTVNSASGSCLNFDYVAAPKCTSFPCSDTLTIQNAGASAYNAATVCEVNNLGSIDALGGLPFTQSALAQTGPLTPLASTDLALGYYYIETPNSFSGSSSNYIGPGTPTDLAAVTLSDGTRLVGAATEPGVANTQIGMQRNTQPPLTSITAPVSSSGSVTPASRIKLNIFTFPSA